ncbi:MAG: glycosyltransferase family 4 protein [Thermodesulfovibrionales bacterium]|nr:glycosyltransferase family 4 protein [Thermodesulfovibrionales bacterium]
MGRKRIVLINPVALFPKVMASQDRVVTMARALGQDHTVDIITLVRSARDAKLNAKELQSVCHAYYPVYAKNSTFLKRKIQGLLYVLSYIFLSTAKRYFYWGGKTTTRRIIEIIRKNQYDIVQIEHWYQGRIFDYLGGKTIKVLAVHDLLFEKKFLEYTHKYGLKIPLLRRRELKKYEALEKGYIRQADVVMSISNQDRKKLEKISPANRHITIPIGQDIAFFKDYPLQPDPKVVLFYGSLSSEQNIVACERVYRSIFPKIKDKISDMKLLIAGAQPPERIKKMHDGENVEVTGFVDDIRKPLSRGWLAIIPLELAGGFRGRVIDLMAMGIPVIGTHNALDCIEMDNGVHGYISDDDSEMAEMAVSLIKNATKRSELRGECQKFVSEKYSLDATYGKLARYYNNL